MDEYEALEAVEIIKPKLVIPMHYDMPILFTKHYASVDESRFKSEIMKLGADCLILKKGYSVQIN